MHTLARSHTHSMYRLKKNENAVVKINLLIYLN